MDKVSVCLCTYNGERFIEQLLDSLTKQSHLPDEIVLCDDNSFDNTLKIVSNFERDFDSINWRIYVNDTNIGWRENFKKCISLSSGDIIFLCDQDDIWEADKIEKMLEVLANKKDAWLLACSYYVFYEDSLHVKAKQPPVDNKIRQVKKNKYLMTPLRPGCTYCFKNCLRTKMIEMWDSSFSHDAMLWRICFLEKKLYLFNYPGIKFRRHSNNASSFYGKRNSSEKYQKSKDNLLMSLLCLQKLIDAYPGLKILKKQINFYKARLEAYETGRFLKIIKLFLFFRFYFSTKEMIKDIVLAKRFGGAKHG